MLWWEGEGFHLEQRFPKEIYKVTVEGRLRYEFEGSSGTGLITEKQFTTLCIVNCYLKVIFVF